MASGESQTAFSSAGLPVMAAPGEEEEGMLGLVVALAATAFFSKARPAPY
jgi:hypothetical protein